MDPAAPLNVALGIALTCKFVSNVVPGSAALISSVYGAYKGYNIYTLATATAVNSGIAGATFFSFREYIVSPLLLSALSSGQFLRRRQELEDKKGKQPERNEKLSWSHMRLHKLPDTALSGALTGGVLNAWKRGPAGIVPGVVTASLLCSLLQLGYNELGVMRIKYVSRKLEEAHKPPASATEIVTLPPEPSKPTLQRVFEWMGMPKISDEEYLKKLYAKRADVLRRIAEIEAEQGKSSSVNGADERKSSPSS
ncbi:uncharacterized protein PHACADRAFT_195221 [Phanerochaete carnosa HHB-10118-sp]|uniref:Uncharacterized protein n=1 Tax=Phanerochaete carnosa (strain HHB-10118-sp) TaxID=650164 RepID=K5W887_PHACS|nr:uncharacterized protein PHACADRAFT_195221 [Phanerochaete carnosa HHB-10118-sp]EKM55194.1 hypothetical protein PHACADRAFT_195221 [Phanerochaete carnosa HHB-10118-sp]